ncbi:hypothetical protein GWI33_003781 [Rhynchophorus ferrugineus]|uniref:Uncharacterized protein n=1 Tax=Rhynchophorus ferrugineus TaxID=354439 RepID=A0A834HJH4_RHYFE|nr:hypothetical protein GWI33_003781 [Rhynchophorus ferrugineus]
MLLAKNTVYPSKDNALFRSGPRRPRWWGVRRSGSIRALPICRAGTADSISLSWRNAIYITLPSDRPLSSYMQIPKARTKGRGRPETSRRKKETTLRGGRGGEEQQEFLILMGRPGRDVGNERRPVDDGGRSRKVLLLSFSGSKQTENYLFLLWSDRCLSY